MNIQLIKGHFEPNDAIELLTHMIHVKIKYHENKMNGMQNEKDLKDIDARIINLQKDLYEIKKYISSKKQLISLHSIVGIE